MIALVRLHTRATLRTVYLGLLPSPPPTVQGAVVRCDTRRDVTDLAEWHAEVERSLPGYPVAVVLPASAELVRDLLRTHVPADPVLFVGELDRQGVALAHAVDAVCKRTAMIRVAEGIRPSPSIILVRHDEERLRRLVAAGAAGKSATRAAREEGVSDATLLRWLRHLGLGSPKRFLHGVRVSTVQQLVLSGTTLEAATRCCGWTGRRAYHLSVRRMSLSAAEPVGAGMVPGASSTDGALHPLARTGTTWIIPDPATTA